MKKRWSNVLAFLALCLMCIIQMVPLYIAFTTAFKPKTDMSSQWMPPSMLYFENFRVAIERGRILEAIFSSFIVTFVSTVLICLIGALAAYPLARRQTTFNKLILSAIIGLIMIATIDSCSSVLILDSNWRDKYLLGRDSRHGDNTDASRNLPILIFHPWPSDLN